MSAGLAGAAHAHAVWAVDLTALMLLVVAGVAAGVGVALSRRPVKCDTQRAVALLRCFTFSTAVTALRVPVTLSTRTVHMLGWLCVLLCCSPARAPRSSCGRSAAINLTHTAGLQHSKPKSLTATCRRQQHTPQALINTS